MRLEAAMTLLWVALFAFAALDTLYGARGRIRERELGDSLDFFEAEIEPRLRLGGDRAATGAELWVRFLLGALGGCLALWVVRDTRGGASDWAEAAASLLAAAALAGRFLPDWLLRRRQGRWLAPLAPLLRLALLAATPLSGLANLGRSLASLASPTPAPNPEEERSSEIAALMEAGQEEGIIEPEDRRLVQSALEFGDRRVREVMVPRPHIVAIPAAATLAELRDLFARTPVNRVPVHGAGLDEILGAVGIRDLWRAPQGEWERTTVAALLQPVLFFPEAATTLEALREMQRRGLRIAIVISEYGAVAGLVTLTDLIEALVGELPAEPGTAAEWQEERDGAIVAAGGLDLDKARELLGVELADGETRTLGGYLAHHLGRIPQAGERIALAGLEIEVLEADPVRVLRVRARKPAPQAAPAPPPGVR